MHGSIIVMLDDKALQDSDFHCPLEDYEMKDWIMGCDYVFKDDEDGFREAIESLADTYSLPEIPLQVLEVDGEQIRVGILDATHIQALKKALDQSVAERMQKVRDELNKAKPSLWEIAYEAYNFSPVYFVLPRQGFFNEVSFADILKGSEQGLYITETFDFHV